MKTKNKTAFDCAKRQINDIHNRIYNLKLLSSINCPKIVETSKFSTIGKTYYVDKDNFDSIAERVMNDEDYFILFNDGCVVNIAYTFDSNGEVLKHKLDFFSVFDSHIYLRIDYSSDEEENKKNKHPTTHLHTSIVKDSFRIPANIPVSPYSFLHMILRYFYNNESDFTNSLVDAKWKKACKEKVYLSSFLNV